MGVIWSKIWHDLWKDRGRTLQVVVIIAVGAFAIGMIINARNLVIREVTEVWLKASPLMIGLAVDPPVDDDMLIVLSNLRGVEIVYKYTPNGAIYWLLIITTLSVVASWFPARGATRISVRESLAYQ